MNKQYFEIKEAIKIVKELSINDNEWKYEIEIDEDNNKYCCIKVIDKEGIFVEYFNV